MSRNGYKKLALIAFAGVFLSSASSARANILFNASFESSITGDPDHAAIENAINSAIAFYTANITTNITVNIAFAETSSGLGQSDTYFKTIPFLTIFSDLHNSSSRDSTDTSLLK